MPEKVTLMKLKVDLQCEKCYKKVKKVLCKFPREIRDQAYDEKNDIVLIKVVSCCPEKIRDKLCCKGGGSIKRIEILEPPNPKPPDKPDKTKDPEPEKKPGPDSQKKKEKDDKETPNVPDKPKPSKEKPPPETKPPECPTYVLPVPSCPPVPPPVAVPVRVCCGPCFQGYGGPPICYDGYFGRPVYDSYGGGRPCYVSRCDQYFGEGNASGCTIM